jgi:uncharacterized protein YbaA (DUF1428 family)
VAAVPTQNHDAYRKHAEMAAPIFKEHGALKLVECWGDDVLDGKVTSLPMAVRKKDDETVVFSWIVWPSKQCRDEGMKKSDDRPSYSARRQPNALRRQAVDLLRLRGFWSRLECKFAARS